MLDGQDTPAEATEPDGSSLAALLEFLRITRGFDFTAYKQTTLQRRLRRRMESLGIEDYGGFKDYLEVHPDEFAHLFNSFLINVTSFFRDAHAWQFVRDEVIPRILKEKDRGQPIRVWSAGCSTGEEPYSLAILLIEALGTEQFRQRVKIYATDVDEEALSAARQASYAAGQLAEMEPPLIDRYFEKHGDRFVFRKELRRSVIFGRHDLIQDAPISHIDLLVCRNTLMYLNLETQSRVLARFHFALAESGFMFLGKVEMLLTRSSSFAPVDLPCRVFRKVHRESLRERMMLIAQAGGPEGSGEAARHLRLRELAMDAGVAPQIVVDSKGVLVLVNDAARRAFNLDFPDQGHLLQDLQLSYRPIELRSHIDECLSKQAARTLTDVEIADASGEPRWIDVHFMPLLEHGDASGMSITFVDVSRPHLIQNDLFRSNQELEGAQEQLHSTNEELETTNEELQSTVEELETTNEELQSTNEELETINEELQSTNDELRLINDQLQLRTTEVNQANAFLQSVLISLRAAVVVVDRDFAVQSWNPKAEDLWGLRADEVRGQPFTELDIGLPVAQLKEPLRHCFDAADASHEREFRATNRRGRVIACHVSCWPLMDLESRIQGALILMEEVRTVAPEKAG